MHPRAAVVGGLALGILAGALLIVAVIVFAPERAVAPPAAAPVASVAALRSFGAAGAPSLPGATVGP
ncbi:MAG TPA: hypothetical protein VKA85_02710 [Candidatus Limnocylindrales bacterium]|nr:hypothetical protein [Candidatus Limnocylindrales bacterium]